ALVRAPRAVADRTGPVLRAVAGAGVFKFHYRAAEPLESVPAARDVARLVAAVSADRRSRADPDQPRAPALLPSCDRRGAGVAALACGGVCAFRRTRAAGGAHHGHSCAD